MNWLKNIFSSGATELVNSLGGMFDDLFTSDEERLAHDEKIQIIKSRIKSAIMKHAEVQLGYVAQYDKEITTRHDTDMKSDSWLSKNVRPMVLIFLTAFTVLLAYLSIFLLPVEKVELLIPWIGMLTTLDGIVFAFYFGSRGLEKMTKVVKN